MKPKWHKGETLLNGAYMVSVCTQKPEFTMVFLYECDAYNLGGIQAAVKRGVGQLLARGQSGKVEVTDPKNKTKVKVSVKICA